MDVVGIDNNTAQEFSKTAFNDSDIMGKDDFLQLLTTQLKYQDPLNPMDNTQFAAQLAQFSSLESLNNINESQKDQIMLEQSMNNSFMTNMIGKKVRAMGNSIKFDGEQSTMDFYLSRQATDVEIKIFDKNGELLNTYEKINMEAGNNEFTWDGMMSNGEIAEAGQYEFEVSATDLEGTEITVETYTSGLVQGLEYQQGSPYLVVNGELLNLGDLISIMVPDETDSGNSASPTEQQIGV